MLMFVIAGVLAMSGCKGSKNLSASKPYNGARSEAAGLYDVMIDKDDFTWYSGKARIKANTPHERMSATLNLRMHRDKVIWATIDKFGFEVARVLITPDSVLVVDRLNKEYTRKSLQSFLLEYGVHIGFGDLQNALIGNMIALTPTMLETKREEDMDLLVVNDITGVIARHWISLTLPKQLMRSFIIDSGGRKLEIENGAWQATQDGSQMPYNRLLKFEDADGVTEIEILFSEITKNVPANVPFSIPQNYAEAR